MSVFDGHRLPVDLFRLDSERLPRGWYSDAYFRNIAHMLEGLAKQGYRFNGARPKDISQAEIETGDIEVEMQFFTRRQPHSLIGGVDEALAILQVATGVYEGERFLPTYDKLDVEAVQDGVILPYSGNPMAILPVLRVRGRYRDFAMLETPILGALAETTRVATNVYEVLTAAHGKDVLFFPARFAHYKMQALHGYAYRLAVQAYRKQNGASSGVFISTDEQGAWWGGSAGGTLAHAAIACFLGDTVETMVQFCQQRPAETPRIALIDFHNDCVGDTLRVMERLWNLYLAEIRAERPGEAARYKLFGVRPDTGGTMRDVSVAPLGDKKLDCGVNPRLVYALRAAIDRAWQDWPVPFEYLDEAKRWCHEVKIVVTGGFAPEKIRRFEEQRVPVDIYGVGAWLLSNSSVEGTNNDFTADIVRVRIDGAWVDMAKVGRRACENPLLERVSASQGT